MPDTFLLIHKALDQYEGLNTQTQDLNTIEHEMEIKEKEMSATEKKIHELMVEISKMEEQLAANGTKLRQLQGHSFKMITAKMKGSLTAKVSKENLTRERLLSELETHREKVAALRDEWQEQHIMHEVLKQQKEEYKWTRDEMEILLGQVFDGPSPDFPQEDDMEEEVSALKATCKRLEDQFQKYRKTENHVMEAQSFLERSITHLREAKLAISQGERDMGRAIEKLISSRRASQDAYSAIESAAAIISGFGVVLDKFHPPLLPEDARFYKSNNTPSECSRLTEFAQDHIRTQTIVKLSLARAARQLPNRAQDTLNQLMAEQEELERAKKFHLAFRKQIIDNIFWEQKEMEKLESELEDVDLTLDDDTLHPLDNRSREKLHPLDNIPSRENLLSRDKPPSDSPDPHSASLQIPSSSNDMGGMNSQLSRSFASAITFFDSTPISALPARRARASSNNLHNRPLHRHSGEDEVAKALRRAFKENDQQSRGDSIDLGRLTSALGVARRSEDDSRSLRSHKSAISLRAALMPPPYEQISSDSQSTTRISPSSLLSPLRY
ncbi:hypothetical protein HK098_000204 [Nowakowskiella sp. JEL0407]|nr:hypothetical protein HK098_000204 [Nowakowskiella sp. JEL0407]